MHNIFCFTWSKLCVHRALQQLFWSLRKSGFFLFLRLLLLFLINTIVCSRFNVLHDFFPVVPCCVVSPSEESPSAVGDELLPVSKQSGSFFVLLSTSSFAASSRFSLSGSHS